MGKYLDILRRVQEAEYQRDISDISDESYTKSCSNRDGLNPQSTFGRFGRFGRTLSKLERRCPDLIDSADWQRTIEDGRRFLAQWAEQAEAFGWTSTDLFGLAPVPDKSAASHRMLSRYDATGLIWRLRGRPVVALTAATAAIESPTGTIIYRRYNKPALGPLGDSLDDFA